MTKFLQRLVLSLFVLAITPPVVAQTVAFEFFEDFDTTEGGSLPEGWLSEGTYPFSVDKAMNYGLIAESGDNILGTPSSPLVRDEVVYSPMMKLAGGKACNVSFSFIAPGGTPSSVRCVGLRIKAGTAQTADAQTIEVGEVEKKAYADWTEFSFSFTPEEDGEYCISFNLYSTLTSTGTVAIEDVEITGEAPEETEPDPQPQPSTTPFEFFEDFDTTDSGNMPEGWLSEGTYPFSVDKAMNFGLIAESGDNILGTPSSPLVRDEVVYSPMMKLAGGKACNVSFSFIAPGGTPSSVRCVGLRIKAGTAQTADAQTIEVGEVEKKAYADWTEFSFSFTPEEDGEYCISFNLYSTLTSTGTVAIEDVEITGESPAETEPDPEIILEPDPENEADAVALPYIEDFEGENYDGTTYVPTKWLATGTSPFTTANLSNFAAVSGSWYLITDNSAETRDERLYTPFFVLTAGTEYTASYYIYMPGQLWGSDEIVRMTDVDFTVGTQQEADFHKSLEKITGYTNTAWEKREVKFTPEITGAYCFSFALSSESPYAGVVAIDDFSITAPGLIPAPKAKFFVNHNYDLMTSNLAVFPGQPVELKNLSQYGVEYEWSVDDESASFDDVNAKNPKMTFTAGGEYKVTLKAKNERAERSTTKTLNVTFFNENGTHAIANNGGEDQMYTRGMIPTFDTSENDFVTGPNHYYRKLAEHFLFPEDVEMSITQLQLAYTSIHYKTIENSREDQFNCKFEIVIYGETDGKLDEEKVFGRYQSTMAETFGTSGVGSGWGEMLGIVFDEPITVSGNCYIAFLIDDNFDLDVDDAYVGASYMSLAGVKHASETTSLYAKPYALPDASRATVGEWATVDLIDPTLKGFGLWTTVWANSFGLSNVALNNAGEIVFDARFDGQNLIVSGTKQGETVRVYSINGSLVISAVAGENSTVVPAGELPEGVYIIKADAGVKKLVK